MRLHRIRLTDYRGVEDRTVLLGPGVTVVEGPNEVGKSSVAEALDLVFRVRCSSEAREVRDVQPVGRDVGPRVEVEFTTGGHHCTYATQWLRDAGSVLEVHAPTREQHVGRAAHDRVREILDATLDHELWSMLRVEQGEGLAQAQLQRSDALAVALDRAAQAGSDPTTSTRLAERAAAAFLELHTAGRGDRSKASLAHRTRADAVRAELDGARGELADVAHDVARHAAVVDELDRAAAAVPELEAAVAAAHGQVEELDDLRAAVAAASERATSTAREARTAAGAAEGRERLAARVDELAGRLRGTRTALAERQQQCDVVDGRLGPLAARLDDEAAAHAGAAAALDLLEARAAAERDRARLQGLLRRVGRADALAADLDALGPALGADAPTDERVQRLAACERAVELARARHEQAAAVLGLTALDDVEVEVLGEPGDGGARRVAAGTTMEVVADGTRVLRVGDLVELRLVPGVDHGSTAAAVEQAEDELRAALAACGAATSAEARGRAERQRTAQARARTLREELDTVLDGVSRAELAARVDQLAARLADAPAPHASSREPSLWAEDELAEEIAAARRDVQAAAAAVAAARDEHDALARQRAALAEALAGLRAREEAQSAEHDSARDDLATARAEVDDDALHAHAVRCDAVAGAARRALREQREVLDGADLPRREELLVRAEERLVRARQRVADRRRERDVLDGRIEATRARGLAERVGELEADLEHALVEARRTDRRAAATARLHTTLERHRDTARRAWVEPLHDELVELGRGVFGDDLDVELDDELRIVARTLGGDTLRFEQLSVGAREQLGLVARLAAARLVDDTQGVPVLLDDVLGFADEQRLAGMRALLGRVGTEAQVVVLTCDATRFAEVEDATVVALR